MASLSRPVLGGWAIVSDNSALLSSHRHHTLHGMKAHPIVGKMEGLKAKGEAPALHVPKIKTRDSVSREAGTSVLIPSIPEAYKGISRAGRRSIIPGQDISTNRPANLHATGQGRDGAAGSGV